MSARLEGWATPAIPGQEPSIVVIDNEPEPTMVSHVTIATEAWGTAIWDAHLGQLGFRRVGAWKPAASGTGTV